MESKWFGPIKIEAKSGTDYNLSVVGFHPSGKIYVVYVAGKDIIIGSYDNEKMVAHKNLSETGLMCYTPFLHICKNGYIHVVWIEAEGLGADKQVIKYRYHDGVDWSEVVTVKEMKIKGVLPGGFVDRKVEDMRMAADENNNIFIALNKWPAGRCTFISKYIGAETKEEGWPMDGRSKHPDVAVGAGHVHLAWQQMWGKKYTIAYCRRVNVPTAKWESPIDAGPADHRPRITIDSDNLRHIIMMADSSGTRIIYYKHYMKDGFSPPITITDRARAYYNTCINVLDKNNVLISDSSGSAFFYNWMQNGKWSGHTQLPTGKMRSKFVTSDLSPTGRGAIAIIDNYNGVYLFTNDGIVPPPDPEPVPDPIPTPVPEPIPRSCSHPGAGTRAWACV